MKICSNCSFSNDEYQAVCSNCGHMLGSNRMYTVQRSATNSFAIASMVLGIASMVLAIASTGTLGFLTGVPAIVFSIIAKKQIRAFNGQQEGAAFATAGLVLGIIATVISVVAIVLIFIFIIVFAIRIAGMSESTYTSY